MAACFNPLHCGAVVASRAEARAEAYRNVFQSPSLRGSGRFSPPRRRRGRKQNVSIPFIAGQWSLREPARVAGSTPGAVSIPFIAGQWSLHAARKRRALVPSRLNPLHCGAVVASRLRRTGGGVHPESQSPSLRGSGRFRMTDRMRSARVASLNPLHCGAVVASGGGASRPRRREASQSPSLRGSGRFAPLRPFLRLYAGLNPLHCGAVVASDQVGG